MIFRTTSAIPSGLVIAVALSLTYMILYSSMSAALSDPDRYAHLKDTQLIAYNEDILEYLTGPLFAENALDFLPDDQRTHMTDVKERFDGAFILYLVAVGFLLGVAIVFALQRMWKHFDELLGRSLVIAGWTLLGLAAFLGAAAALSFGRLWILLHAVLFPQGNWMFSADSILIQLYPTEFFVAFATSWLLRVSIFGAAAVLLGLFLRRMRHAEEEFMKHAKRRKAR